MTIKIVANNNDPLCGKDFFIAPKKSRRQWLQNQLAVLVGLVLLLPPLAHAQSFPSKPLKIVVPNAAGGAADLTARAVGAEIAKALGQAVVIDNRPSAGGIVAGEQVAKAAADGHTLLLVSSGTAVSAAMFKQLPFDTVKDFSPVSLLATFDLGVVVADNSPFKTFADLLAYGRANPGKLNIGTPNIGTTQHLAAELLKANAGIDAQIVPFNGTPAALTALRGGTLHLAIDILGPLMTQINAKALRPLAVLGDKRAAQLADVPTVRESGGALASFNVSSWNGLAVPAQTPKDVVARLAREVQTALALPDIKKRLADLNLTAHSSTPAELADVLNADIKRWGEVIQKAGIARQ
jgi:tripartite-type tricarboxylate transporter receptor subunit TctC